MHLATEDCGVRLLLSSRTKHLTSSLQTTTPTDDLSSLTPLFSRAPSMLKMKGRPIARRLQQLVGRRLRQRLHKTHSRFFIAKLLVKPMRLISMLSAIDDY